MSAGFGTAESTLLFRFLDRAHPCFSTNTHTPTTMSFFAPLRSALPKLARLAPRAAHSPALVRPLSTSVPRPSLLSSLPRRPFPPPPKSGSRGIATAPAVGSAGQVDWTKVATSCGIAAVSIVGLNLALNRETRDALSLAESS